MLQRDYFMKMTEMLAAVLSKVLFNKEKKNYSEAEKEIESAAKTIVGLDFKLISLLNPEDIISLMKTSDVYAGRCLITAELLKEYGNILGEKGNAKESINVYVKSLWLYVESVLTKELPSPEDYFPKINFLIKNLSAIEIPVELSQKIFEYFEFSGQYSKAEDILFDLINSDTENIQQTALKFYNKLKQLPEEELIKGNLSREEVDESLGEIISRFET